MVNHAKLDYQNAFLTILLVEKNGQYFRKVFVGLHHWQKAKQFWLNQ